MAAKTTFAEADIFKVLAISDIHMSNSLPYAKPGERAITDRLQDQIRLWEHVGQQVQTLNIDLVLILGDLFDHACPDPVTLTETIRAVVSIPCPVRIMAGNHDTQKNGPGRFNVEAFGAISHPRVGYLHDRVMLSPQPWLHFYPVPFCGVEEAQEQIALAKKTLDVRYKGDQNILLLHHSILGCEHLGWTCDDGLDGDVICEGFDMVLSGHFHQHQRFGPDLQGMYLGSPMHHNYGDIEREASYFIFTFHKGDEPEETQCDPGLPKFHKLIIKDGIWPEWEPGEEPAKGDYLRAEVHATHAEWIALKPQVMEECARLGAEKGIRATFKHKPIYHHSVRLEGSDKDAKKGMSDYLRMYVKQANRGDMDAKALLALGKEILEEASAP